MSDLTRILSAIEDGDPDAAEQLLPLVYKELRKLAASKMAQEKPGQTLQATALVHEAYLRLVDGEKAQHWNSRGHFFGAAAEAMRRILVENARGKARHKRGGDWGRSISRNLISSRQSPPDNSSPSMRQSRSWVPKIDWRGNWSIFGILLDYRWIRPLWHLVFRPQLLIGIGLMPGHGCGPRCSITVHSHVAHKVLVAW